MGGMFIARWPASSVLRGPRCGALEAEDGRQPTRSSLPIQSVQDIFEGTVVEIAYSYRVAGELYTGFHEEPCFLNEAEYRPRFPVGRTFVVRVKSEEPQVALLRDDDQVDGVAQRLARIGAK